jgi:uncharacterized protein (DUF58 family)
VNRSDLLPPHLLDRLGGLELIAKSVVQGFVTGLHQAPFKGAGLDFAGHRPYQQGDELRRIDWRLFGRTDRHYVREYREDASLQAYIVLDATLSMGFVEPDGLPKLRYAQILSAALAHIMLTSGDAVGLAAFGEDVRLCAQPRSRAGHLHDLLIELERLRPSGDASAADAVDRAAGALKRRGRVVLVSDLLEEDDGARLVDAAGRLRARGDEVIVLRVLTPTEAGRRSGPAARWFDPERPHQSVTAALGEGGLLATRVEAYYAALSRRLADHGVEYVPLFTDELLERALRRWIATRGEVPRAAVRPSR